MAEEGLPAELGKLISEFETGLEKDQASVIKLY